MFKHLQTRDYTNVWGKQEGEKKTFPQSFTKYHPLLFRLKKGFLQCQKREKKWRRGNESFIGLREGARDQRGLGNLKAEKIQNLLVGPESSLGRQQDPSYIQTHRQYFKSVLHEEREFLNWNMHGPGLIDISVDNVLADQLMTRQVLTS